MAIAHLWWVAWVVTYALGIGLIELLERSKLPRGAHAILGIAAVLGVYLLHRRSGVFNEWETALQTILITFAVIETGAFISPPTSVTDRIPRPANEQRP